jgi:hypothetical protein
MAKHAVRFVGAGSADWTKPVRAGPNTLNVTYDGYFMIRMDFHFGQQFLLRTRMLGADDMSDDGLFLRGSGIVDAEDADGDVLTGNVVWHGEDDKVSASAGRATARGDAVSVDGVLTFSHGTGKWEGATGSLSISVWALPEDLDEPMPPQRPLRFHAFMEGAGGLAVRALASG